MCYDTNIVPFIIKLHCTRLCYKSAILELGFIYGIKTYRMPLAKSYVKIQSEDVEVSNITGTDYLNVIPQKQLFIPIHILSQCTPQFFRFLKEKMDLQNCQSQFLFVYKI